MIFDIPAGITYLDNNLVQKSRMDYRKGRIVVLFVNADIKIISES